MLRYPNMLMLGAAGRNTGKTEFACRLIRRYRQSENVIGLKITTIDESRKGCPRGKKGCGVCHSFDGPFELTEEKTGPSGKDTIRMLEAGAHRVFWLKAKSRYLEEAVTALCRSLDTGACIICESNSCRRVLDPGMFLVIQKSGSRTFKRSCRDVVNNADRTLTFYGNGWNLSPDRLTFSEERWFCPEDASAIILAGGKSRRMGRDKSLLPVYGKPMIERIATQLRGNFKDILISSNSSGKYSFLGLPVIPDRKVDMGPLMGIMSTLAHSQSDLNFVTGCDIPEIRMPIVRRMLQEAADGYDIVIPMSENKQFEPLFAVYRKSVVPHCQLLLARGHRKISDLFHRVRVRYIPFDGSDWYENLNTPGDFEMYKQKFD